MSIFFSKTDNLSKIAIYKLYLEVEILGLDIRLSERMGLLDDFFHIYIYIYVKYN